MKILIIGFSKLAYMPYINFYLNHLPDKEHEIHVLYWNRDEKEDIPLPYNVKFHEFRLFQEDEVAKISKITSFLKFKKYTKRVLQQENFDILIILTTLPGIILSDVLKKYYANKFILDYRDVTFERFKFFKKILHTLVENSIATFVSSNAFRINLPFKKQIYTSHNILLDLLNHRNIRKNKTRKIEPIRIRYWGFIRHESINKVIISRLANDIRFELHYHGREQATAQSLKEYCKEYQIRNVFFHGEYKPDERYKFAEETDLIHNMFDNDNTMKPAMANKYYDGVALYLPQICHSGSFMGEQITNSKIGLECNPYVQTFADEIYDYYNSINWDDFEENCNIELNKILEEYQKGLNVIKSITKELEL